MLNQCEHKGERKERLVAWATDYKTTHTQGFKYLLSCTGCGAVLEKKVVPYGVMR